MTYVANATNFRFALLTQHANPKFNASAKIRESEDVCQTYKGYIKFLATDLRTVYPLSEKRTKSKYKQGVEYIAKQMLARGDVREKCSEALSKATFKIIITNCYVQGLCQRCEA